MIVLALIAASIIYITEPNDIIYKQRSGEVSIVDNEPEYHSICADCDGDQI